MKTFRNHLKRNLKNKDFSELFDEEKELIQVSLEILNVREKSGLTQSEIAKAAHLTQQQVSKVENGVNCNIMTYLKVGHAMGLSLSIHPLKMRKYA